MIREMKKIAFTICSFNYLAQAWTLADSLRQHAPEYECVVCISDRGRGRGDAERLDHRMLWVDAIGDEVLDEMRERYSVVEFCTSIKPLLFLHFFKTESAVQVVYLDPDVLLLHSLDCVNRELEHCEILVTPHALSPFPFDDCVPRESQVLKFGLYNLGFLALREGPGCREFLLWWWERTRRWCHMNPGEGLYTDQKWVDLAPLFFSHVSVSRNPGLNVAPWNLHERNPSLKEGCYFVHDFPLIFYHFSKYNPHSPQFMSAMHEKDEAFRYSFENRPILKRLYDEYRTELLAHDYDLFAGVSPSAWLTPDATGGAVSRSRGWIRRIGRCLRCMC